MNLQTQSRLTHGNRPRDLNLTNDQEINAPTTANIKEQVKNQEKDNNKQQKRKVLSISKISKNSNIKSKLKVINTNAQSLQYKIEELKQVVNDKDVKIIAITESWAQDWKEATLEMKGFNMFR